MTRAAVVLIAAVLLPSEFRDGGAAAPFALAAPSDDVDYRARAKAVQCTACIAVGWTLAEMLDHPDYQCGDASKFRNPTKRGGKRKSRRECLSSELRKEVILETLCSTERLDEYGLYAPQRHKGFGDGDMSRVEIGGAQRPPVFRKKAKHPAGDDAPAGRGLKVLQTACHEMVEEFEDDLFVLMRDASREGLLNRDIAKRQIAEHLCARTAKRCKDMEDMAGKWPVEQEYEEHYNAEKKQYDRVQEWLNAGDDVPQDEQLKMKERIERTAQKRIFAKDKEKAAKEKKAKDRKEAAARRMKEYGREPRKNEEL